MAILTSQDDSVVTKQFSLDQDPVVIGRHPQCEIHIDDGSVSRRHAEITYDGGQYYVRDLNSRNGTFLNDQPIQQPTRLLDQSEIRICDVTLVFNLADEAARTVTPPPTADSRVTGPKTVLLDDIGSSNSQILSQFDIPSHHSGIHNLVSAEEKLATLTKITHALSETVERDAVLAKILDFLFELFTEADRGFVILKNSEGILEPLGVKTRRPGLAEQIRISRTIVDQVMTSKRPIISSDAASDDRFDMSKSIVDFRIRSIMCAPLINSKDESIGVIQLDTLKHSTTFHEGDVETFVAVALQASLAIQKSDLFVDAKRSEALKTDLALAHELQHRFLPQRSPEFEGYDFYSYYRPMQQVGGDYFDYVELSKDKVAIIIADVVGHGVAAALLMAKVSAESRFALATSESAVEAVSRMNRNLSDLNIDRFVTLALGLLDKTTNQMTIVNAGHMPPILRSAKNEQISQLAIEEAGLPLGIMDDFEYESIDISLEPGDTLLLYTDGINEAMNENGEQLTTETLVNEIKMAQAKSPESIGQIVRSVVSRHMGRQRAIDDMCLVCVGRNLQLN
ncbi:MAG: SpoIIE family protein phosphatase [Planctomycetota bacterium]